MGHAELMARMIRPTETQPRRKKKEPEEFPCGVAVATPEVLPAYTRYRDDLRGWSVRYFSAEARTCLRAGPTAELLVPNSSRAALDAVTRAPPLKWRPVKRVPKKKQHHRVHIPGGRPKRGIFGGANNRPSPSSRKAAPLPTFTLTPVKKKK